MKIRVRLLYLLFGIIFTMVGCSGGSGNSVPSQESGGSKPFDLEQPPFSCIADEVDPCGCLIQNDGTENPLIWYRYSSTKAYSFSDASSSFISEFNSGSGHCGFTDWRIPSVLANPTFIEYSFGQSGLSGDFANLVNYAHVNGFDYNSNLSVWLNSHGFGDGLDKNIQQATYWSANKDEMMPNGSIAWYVSMGIPYAKIADISFAKLVLPVRGGYLAWNTVGLNPPTTDNSGMTNIVYSKSNNKIYIAYIDTNTHPMLNHPVVMTLNNNSWVKVGDLSNVYPVDYIQLGIDDANQLYLLYSNIQNNDKLTVMKFNTQVSNSRWTNVGNSAFTNSATSFAKLVFNPVNNQPYVAYVDGSNSDKATVMRYNGEAWEYVGQHVSDGGAMYTDIAFNPITNQPYVAYTDKDNLFRPTIRMLENNSWVTVGNQSGAISNDPAKYVKLAFPLYTSVNSSWDKPYAIYTDLLTNKLSAMTLKNNAWINVGNPSFSVGGVDYPQMAFSPVTNNLYVLYKDIMNYGKATVMTFNGKDWVYVGKAGFSSGIADYTDIVFNTANNQPYVVYQDMANSGRATVMTLSNW